MMMEELRRDCLEILGVEEEINALSSYQFPLPPEIKETWNILSRRHTTLENRIRENCNRQNIKFTTDIYHKFSDYK